MLNKIKFKPIIILKALNIYITNYWNNYRMNTIIIIYFFGKKNI